MYKSASTIRQGVKAKTDAKVLKAKLALNWTDPYKILAVGPCSAAETPDGSPLGRNLLYSDLPSDLPGSDARRRVAIEPCKPCANPHDSGDMPKYLPAGLAQYVVVNSFSKKSPPYHVTHDDVSIPLQRLEVKQIITGHQSVRGRGGVIAVLYKTHWAGLSEPSWERETNGPPPLPLPHLALLGRNPGPAPPNQPPLPPNADRGGTAQALPQQRGTFPSAGLRLCSPRRLARVATTTHYFLREPTFGTRETMGYGGLKKSARALPRPRYT